MTAVVEVDQLKRVYQYSARPGRRRPGTAVTALGGVSLTVSQGEIVGLLGPNGAGKTTLIKILSTVLLPTSGSARILGYDVTVDAAAIRGRIGILFGGDRGLYGRLTVRDNLDYWAAMYCLSRRERAVRIPEVLGRVGLADRAQTPADRLSRGMKQRLHLARSLINDPELIIMDEPTSGMDPVAARQFRNLVTELRREGRTILLATHDMAEAEALCDRIVLIDRGLIRGIEDPKAIGQWLARYESIEARGAGAALLDQVRSLPGAGEITDIGDGWVRISTTCEGASYRVLKLLVDSGISAVRTSFPSLEDVYMQVIGDRGLNV